jgi:hypothetical protein
MYKFENLKNRFDEWGYPPLEAETGFHVIQTDFETAFRNGQIRVDPDGIFIEYEGREYRGYMFIKEYHVTQFNAFPKFHLVRCRTIDTFINNGWFNQRYQFSNSQTNDVLDIDTDTLYPDKTLRLCQNCAQLIEEDIRTTEDFFRIHGQERPNGNVEVDIMGYVRDWPQMSRAYRQQQNFTCESCGLHIDNNMDKRYLHVHHINGDKLNNSEANLKCLCALCHTYQDETHQDNFLNHRNRYELRAFVNKYHDKLEEHNNPYLQQYLTRNN